MSVEFDPNVIRAFADDLYRQAQRVVLYYTVVSAMGGALAGAFVALRSGGGQTGILLTGAIFGLIAGLLGRQLGLAKSFHLRLMAQTALCQLQIEQNTSGNASLKSAA